ncbi:MAG: glycogen debranching protein GlgX [Methylococcaceae bacterium]|nr:glycogen debranching protein GlgX [Methylococcaceae bacterium]
MSAISTETGNSSPLGATMSKRGVNFSLYAKSATGVELTLFDEVDAFEPSRTIALDPGRHRTYHYWHCFVPGIVAGQLYGYRVRGPWDPARGQRFDASKILLDPYGKAVAVPAGYRREEAARHGTAVTAPMKSVVSERRGYDWEGDRPLNRPFSQTLIYEMHVRGFTRHPSSGLPEAKRGTYAGLIDKIPYLQSLGITAVELLPVFHFDSQDAPPGRSNYWGYAPISFFAPHGAYSSRRDPLGPLDEFRDMVKALHRAGIEIILDVVFNHTAEGDQHGPTLSLRGLANDVYYLLEADRARYANYSGTGNTLNAGHPVVRQLIRDSLRYWVREMHVDGFRFDLASILGRDSSGRPLPDPPLLLDIEADPVLAGTKLIAEPWDAGGLYQVGSFVGDAWKEWNGLFRDDVRSFFRGDDGSVGRFASRMLGSPDVYSHEHREPEQSINFVTCHDGFTLNDLVSYSRKNNWDNGENNRDGNDDNRSWNFGVEGPSDDTQVERLRNRQVKNLLTATLLALGVPMIAMGDEVRRSQKGNNNAYCQDELSWFDWGLLERHGDVRRFLSLLASQRMPRDSDAEALRLTLDEVLTRRKLVWHGVETGRPDWSEHSHSLALETGVDGHGPYYFAMFNAYHQPLTFQLPPQPDGPWRRWIDTALASPDDIAEPGQAPEVAGTIYRVAEHSVAVLIAG